MIIEYFILPSKSDLFVCQFLILQNIKKKNFFVIFLVEKFQIQINGEWNSKTYRIAVCANKNRKKNVSERDALNKYFTHTKNM